MRLKRAYYRQNSYNLARSLLGKVICINQDGETKKYRITETECYGGATDKAAHSYNNKKTPRTKPLFLDGGHVYIYFIYGMYYMLNIVANIENIPEGVLIRSVEPIDANNENKLLTNGPGKLCNALGIDKTFNEIDLCYSDVIYLIDDGYKVEEIVFSKRVNIDYAEEDKDRLWRFYVKNNKYISKK